MGPLWMPTDIRRRTRPAAVGLSVDRAQRRPHLDRSAGGPRSVVVPREHKQQRIAAELEQAAALEVGNLEHVGEHEIEDRGEFLRSDTATLRELL